MVPKKDIKSSRLLKRGGKENNPKNKTTCLTGSLILVKLIVVIRKENDARKKVSPSETVFHKW